MRILFDHQVFSWQNYGGISRYFVEQMRGLKNLGQDIFLPEHFYSENAYLRVFPEYQRKSLTSFSFKGKKVLQNAMGRKDSIQAIRKHQPDVFHPTYFDPYFLKTVKRYNIPFVLTVHDMIHEIYGHGSRGVFSLDAQVIERKRILAENANAIIAVSANTRQDLLRLYPELNPEKVHVIHHGNSLNPEDSYPLGKHNINFKQIPYLLFVGQRKAYKNFSWMVEQLADLLRTYTDLKLICVGGSAFDPIEMAQFARLGLSNKIQYLIVGSDAELAQVYSQASCFIFPSQYEGFGIPVLEAFACGCPVVLNRVSSLPEVGGDAATYFEEEKPGSLAFAVQRILEDNSFRETMIRMGKERARQFTWQQSASRHLAVYQTVVN